MKFHISSNHYVALRRGRVSFENKGRRCNTLNRLQFFNLSDVIDQHLELQAYPYATLCGYVLIMRG